MSPRTLHFLSFICSSFLCGVFLLGLTVRTSQSSLPPPPLFDFHSYSSFLSLMYPHAYPLQHLLRYLYLLLSSLYFFLLLFLYLISHHHLLLLLLSLDLYHAHNDNYSPSKPDVIETIALETIGKRHARTHVYDC